MADRYFKDQVKTLEGGIVELYGKLTFGSSGAISAQSCKGFSVAIVDSTAGRYTVTLEDKYPEFKGCDVTLQGPDSSALTTADGNQHVVRAVNMANKTFLLQLVRTDTGADADPTSGTIAYLKITLKNSTAY